MHDISDLFQLLLGRHRSGRASSGCGSAQIPVLFPNAGKNLRKIGIHFFKNLQSLSNSVKKSIPFC